MLDYQGIDLGRQRAWLLYDGKGIEDRGVPMSEVVTTRPPVALLNLETMVQYDLTDACLTRVGRSRIYDSGDISFAINAWSTDRYHALVFDSVASAIQYLDVHHPGLSDQFDAPPLDIQGPRSIAVDTTAPGLLSRLQTAVRRRMRRRYVCESDYREDL